MRKNKIIPEYKIEDQALVKWKQAGTSKLRPPWDGPYEITKILNNQSITIKRGEKEITYNKSDTKLFIVADEDKEEYYSYDNFMDNHEE